MARVLISKASLADFGVPRQEITARQPMPTAEQIEQAVRQSDVALTPMQYATKIPLIERDEPGHREKFSEYGEIPREFKGRMGVEGALAHGVAARDYPQLLESEPRNIPFLRDYYGRQTTLPEFDWSYKTEGPYYDEQGNILPGQVPPVDAIKVMGADDIAQLGDVTGFGLKPIPYGRVNRDWEADVKTQKRFPVDNAGFVGAISEKDALANFAANVGREKGKGVVGIRGFGRPQDKAFARGAIGEGREGVYTEPISPERLVGVMGGTPMSSSELERGGLKHIYSPKKDYGQQLQELVDEGEISPIDAMYSYIRHRAQNKHYPGDKETDQYYPHILDIGETDAGPLTPARFIQRQVDKKYKEALPMSWQQGVFGLENPLLTEEEKRNYIADINAKTTRSQPVDYFEEEELPVLYPKRAGVRYA